MLADPDLSNPKLEPNFFMDFKRLSELILNVEDSSLLILKRCEKDDEFLSSLLHRICTEVGYKDPPPLCSALSFQYFQALVDMDIVMTPQNQAYELLSLPDLYHELAHFVLFRNQANFELPALTLIHGFFAEMVRKGQQRGLPQGSLDAIVESHRLWTGDWHVEFACDMIATYWCGPAYGWANLRLSATRGDPYQDSLTHPADDSRKTGIENMLQLINEASAAQEIDARWFDLKRLSPSAQPPGYAKRYPARLLEQLAQIIHQACIAAIFQSFSDQKSSQNAVVSHAVSEAWTSFQKDAKAFSRHEQSALQSLRVRLTTT
jgi:hypothetical protein